MPKSPKWPRHFLFIPERQLYRPRTSASNANTGLQVSLWCVTCGILHLLASTSVQCSGTKNTVFRWHGGGGGRPRPRSVRDNSAGPHREPGGTSGWGWGDWPCTRNPALLGSLSNTERCTSPNLRTFRDWNTASLLPKLGEILLLFNKKLSARRHLETSTTNTFAKFYAELPFRDKSLLFAERLC